MSALIGQTTACAPAVDTSSTVAENARCGFRFRYRGSRTTCMTGRRFEAGEAAAVVVEGEAVLALASGQFERLREGIEA